MAVKIRLKRIGAKKKPFYRIVVADARYPRDGRFIEQIGTYDPMPNPAKVTIDGSKALKWIKNGAQPTDTVRALLKKTGALEKAAGEAQNKQDSGDAAFENKSAGAAAVVSEAVVIAESETTVEIKVETSVETEVAIAEEPVVEVAAEVATEVEAGDAVADGADDAAVKSADENAADAGADAVEPSEDADGSEDT